LYDGPYFQRLQSNGNHTGIDKRAYLLPWLRRLVKKCKAAAVIIDLGCGDGYFLRHLPKNMQLVGIDISESALRSHLLTQSCIPVVQADVLSCPLKSSIADFVLLLDVIEHLQKDSQLLSEVARILKPGGYVLLSTPNLSSFGCRNKGEHWFAYRDSTHCNLQTFDYWVQLLRQADFQFIRVGSDSLWDTPYQIRLPLRLQWLLGGLFSVFTRLIVGFLPWKKGENFYALVKKREAL
jgi:SAM-dependent methyltransferase